MVERYDILGRLPIEISQKILMYGITPQHLLTVSRCCKRWNEIISGSYFWRKRSEQDYNFAGSEYMDSEYYRKYVQKFSNPWKGHYTFNCELEFNWKNGISRKYSLENIFNVKRIVYLDDDILIVAKPHQLCIISISMAWIEKKFQADHLQRAVVEKSVGLLIALCHNSESDLSIIKMWDLKSKETTVKFEHQFSLKFSQFWVYKHLIAFTIFEESQLYVFNITTENFDYQRRQIPSMCFGSDTIVIVTGSNLMEIMDLNFNVLTTLTCCDDKVIQRIQIKNNLLFAESERTDAFLDLRRLVKSICVWDLTAKARLFIIEDGQFVDLTFLNKNKIICLKRNLGFYNCLVSLSLPDFVTQKIGQKTSQFCMYASNNRFLFTDITDTSLKMLCARTQKIIRRFCMNDFNPGRYLINRIGQNDTLMVSNRCLAFIDMVDGRDIVHVIDFGPAIKNKITY